MITIKKAAVSYQGKPLFSGLDLALRQGQWIALLGPSGVGKSSLLRLIAGLLTTEDIHDGQIEADNGMPVSEQIAYMAQTDLLLPWLSIRDNVLLGLKLKNHTHAARHAIIEQAEFLLAKTGIQHASHLYPPQLSGGMRQRAALVRTLLQDKPIILMDEPFSALDAITRYKLQTLAAELLHDKTVFFITHDPVESLRLAHDIYVMQGQPATIQLVVSLTSPTPREPTAPELLSWHATFMQQLTQASDA